MKHEEKVTRQETAKGPARSEADGNAVTLSRRSVLSAGLGLAAAACHPPAAAAGVLPAAQSDPVVRAIRANRRVIGRVANSAGSLGADMPDTIAPSYFPQPGEMAVYATGREKNLTLDVDYLELDFVKNDDTIVRGRVRAYNRHVPGPTIRCDPGDRLNITLRNNLPIDEKFDYDYQDCTTDDASGRLTPAEAGLPHGFNTTNLHTHGLHVSPKSVCGAQPCGEPPYAEPPTLASDDVFISVPPGAQQEYCIVLPQFHAPGTHWYHAHKHGSTGIQVNNGLVGALIVRERGKDRILGREPHEDQILLMQEIMETDGGNDQLVYARTQGDTSKFFINGIYHPRMRMHTGEIQRWRFINATSRPRGLTKLRLVKLGAEALRDTSDIEPMAERGQGLDNRSDQVERGARRAQPERFERVRTFQRIARDNAQPIHLISVDGISLYGQPPREVLEWDFAPGNRADFLVKIDQPGNYAIVKDLHPWATNANPEVQTLAFIEVTEGRRRMRMPSVIPGERRCYLEPIETIDASKTVDFHGIGSGQWASTCQDVEIPWTCADERVICDGETRSCNQDRKPVLLPRIFTVDCARFSPNEVESKYTMELNTAEEWTLRNFAGGAHPFHIHVNPFQVVETFDPQTGETARFEPSEALWQDVVAIPPAANGTPGHVTIRQRYLTFPGDFVIHCHFLNHEDLGMMKRVRVVPRPGASGHPPCRPVRNCSSS